MLAIELVLAKNKGVRHFIPKTILKHNFHLRCGGNNIEVEMSLIKRHNYPVIYVYTAINIFS